jgi:hypothetical protein
MKLKQINDSINILRIQMVLVHEKKYLEKAYLFEQPPRLNFNFFVPAVRMTNERVSNRVQNKPQTLNLKHPTLKPERVSNRIQSAGVGGLFSSHSRSLFILTPKCWRRNLP